MIKTDVVVIGAGLIGSMTAKYLRSKGMEVIIIDSRHLLGASKCSFGTWKEGWVNPIIKDEYDDGVDLLKKYTGGIKEVEFLVRPKNYNNRSVMRQEVDQSNTKIEKFNQVDCKLILNEEFITGSVINIEGKKVTIAQGKEKTKETYQANVAIIIAAGVWTTDILIDNGLTDNLPYLDMQWGSVFKLEGDKLPINQMKEWSPYKQSMFVNMGKNLAMFGDGVTVKNPKPGGKDNRVQMTSERILIHMNELLLTRKWAPSITSIMEGYRPYLNKTKSSTKNFVNQHSSFVISATGGAKNSTILCGHMAKEIYRKIKENGK